MNTDHYQKSRRLLALSSALKEAVYLIAMLLCGLYLYGVVCEWDLQDIQLARQEISRSHR